MKLPVIDGKKAVPVRLIPFITHGKYGRKIISDILAHEFKVCGAELLAKHHAEVVEQMAAERRGMMQDNGIASLDDILSGDYKEESGDALDWIEPYAYRLDDDGKAEIVPIDEWRTVCAKIRPIIELAHQKEDKIGVEGAKRQKWHTATLRVIPDDAFMWKEDLEKIFPAEELNYKVWLDDKCRPLVQAAFDRLSKVIAVSSPTIKLPVIAGKEVIPVRLIPLITDPEITPLQLVEYLWNPRGDFLKRLNHYPFYGDWSRFCEEMEAVANGGIGKQLEQFHSGMYVVRTDFEEHECIVSNAVLLGLDRAIPAPLLALAFEGFEASPVTSFDNPAPAPCHITAKTREQLIVPLAPPAEVVEQEKVKEQKKSATEELVPFAWSSLKTPEKAEKEKHYSQESERLIRLGYSKQDIGIALKAQGVDPPMIGGILCSGGNPDDGALASRANRLINQGIVFGERKKKKP